MAKAKTAVDDGKTQRQRFIEASHEHGASEDADAFRRAVRGVATLPPKKAAKAKKAAKKPKRKG